ncbi:PREDICTED: F-box protein At2g41170 isoform X2 [Tarenaya hassleriana]|nr:PREDICTED: F-box protein At2g41170 isoform X2 [Tarenaya hassleriana]XP_019059328.1 PREDICTED: F-box protein At2g41170 isoform X2 [Tarenaya hassleriana]
MENKKNWETERENRVSLLDLPELALELVLEKLSPAELCVMACVCSELRERCMSDHLWEKHMKNKWGRLMGDAATREWRSHVAAKMSCLRRSNRSNTNWNLLSVLAKSMPFSLLSAKTELGNNGNGGAEETSSCLSVMSWYSSLENGKFSFPAQVFNRENGHVGFMMSCYDAEIRYNSKLDTFRARYSPCGRRTAEENVTWERLRSPPVDTPSRALHESDCLHELRPDDHVEIQWRRSKEFPYGWWYGIVGHLQICSGHEKNCLCESDENVVLEFRQFRPESPWRTTVIRRTDHRETGNESDGFYGGVRKLYAKEEISTWNRLWPTQVLE